MFDYIVGKLVEWDSNCDLVNLNNENINKSLSKFTSVGLMKLLYFICLQSVNEKNSLIESKQANKIRILPSDNIDLFQLFNNFVALPKGPAEDDVYSHRSALLSYRYIDKRLIVTTEYIESFKFSYPKVTQQNYNQNTISEILNNQIAESDTIANDGETSLATFKEITNKAIANLKIVFASKNISFIDFEYLVELTHKLPLWNHYIRCTNNKYCLTEEELKKETSLFMSI